jgi:hypothetical protein
MDNCAFVTRDLALRHRNRSGVELLNSSTPLIYNNINLSAFSKPGALFEPPRTFFAAFCVQRKYGF